MRLNRTSGIKMPEISVPFQLRNGVYGEVTLSVESESLLTEKDLIASLRGNRMGEVVADLKRRESMKEPKSGHEQSV